MNPRVICYNEKNLKGDHVEYEGEGAHGVREAFTQSDLIGKQFYIIHTKKVGNKEYALDKSGDDKKGTKFHLWTWDKNNMNQIFTMTSNGTIKSVKTGLALDVNGGNFKNGTSLISWDVNNGPNQMWVYDSNKKTLSVKDKNFNLNIHNYNVKDGAELNIWEPNGHESQMWDIRLCEVKPAQEQSINVLSFPKEWVVTDLSIGKFESLIGKPFILKSRGNNNFVMDTRGHQNGGGEIGIWTNEKNVNQVWTVDRYGHLISWQNRNSILYCDNSRDGTKPTIIGMRGNDEKTESTQSKWRMMDDGRIVSLYQPNQSLDVAESKYANGTWIVLWHYHGGNNQKWDAEVTGEGDPSMMPTQETKQETTATPAQTTTTNQEDSSKNDVVKPRQDDEPLFPNGFQSLLIRPMTDVIITEADTDTSKTTRTVILHNGNRYKPDMSDKDLEDASYAINDLNSFGLKTVKNIELKTATNDNKKYSRLTEEKEGFIYDYDGTVKLEAIIIIVFVLMLGVFLLIWYLNKYKGMNIKCDVVGWCINNIKERKIKYNRFD